MARMIEDASTITMWIDELIEQTEASNSGQSGLHAELLLDDLERLMQLTPDPVKVSGPTRLIFPADLLGFDVARIQRVAREIHRGRSAIENEQVERARTSFMEARRLWVTD